MAILRETLYFTFALFRVPIHLHIIFLHSEIFTFKGHFLVTKTVYICKFSLHFILISLHLYCVFYYMTQYIEVVRQGSPLTPTRMF